MADYQGILASGLIGGYKNPRLSDTFDEFITYEIIGWPPFETLCSPGYMAEVVSMLPVSVVPRAIRGFHVDTYLQDFYFRIHLVPIEVALGNVSSSQGFNVVLWNAYLEPKTVVSVVGGTGAGITIEPPGALPYTIAALAESSWGVTVSAEGDPYIDENIEFNFSDATSGVRAPSLHITGMRVTMWPFVPDWTQPITEQLDWATDILTSATGAEQRRSLRLSPRRYFEARFVCFRAERPYFDMLLTQNGAGLWALPLWPEMQILSMAAPAGSAQIACTTANREFRPGTMIVLRASDTDDVFTVETAIIDSVLPGSITLQRPLQLGWSAGSRLYPARSARLFAQPSVERVTDRDITTSIKFEFAETNDWNAALPATTYRGFSVFDARPDEATNLTAQYLRILQTLDNVAGIPAVTDTASAGFSAQAHAWFLAGDTELYQFKQLMYALRGRQVSVWVPTHMEDMQLVLPANNDVMVIKNTAYTRFGLNKVGKRDIRIERADGTATMHRVTAATELADGTERLVIDPLLTEVLPPENIGRISFMALCRLDSDSVTIEHVSDVTGLSRASVVWRSLRDEVEVLP